MKCVFNNGKVLIIVIVLFSGTNNYGQKQIKLIVDTVFSKSYKVGDKFVLYGGKSEKSKIVSEYNIQDFYNVKKITRRFFQRKLFVNINKKWYLTDEQLNVDFNKFYYGDECKYRYKGFYPFFLFERNDSIFIDNIDNPNSVFIKKRGGSTFNNPNYVILQDVIDDKIIFFIYNIGNNEITKLPKGFKFLNSDNSWFIIEKNTFEDYGSFIIDIDLNVIVDTSDNYKATIVKKDFLLIEPIKKFKPFKLYYKNKIVKLPSYIYSVEEIDDKGYIYATNTKGKYGVIDKDLNTIFPFEYDLIESGFYDDCMDCIFYDGFLMAKKNGISYLYNKNLKLVFKGEYDEVWILDENRLQARKAFFTSVVDFDNNIIIAPAIIGDESYSVKEDFGIKYIRLAPFSFFSYDGEKIAAFENDDNYFFWDFWGGLSQRSNPNMLKLFNDDQIKKINKYDLWIFNDINKKELYKLGRHNKYYILNHNLDKIAGPYQQLKQINGSKRFVFETYSRNIGALEVLDN